MAVVTSGDGVIYNVARAKMLAATFRWTDTDKYASIVDADYVFNEAHRTLHDVASTVVNVGTSPLLKPFVSANAWAGSDPPQFANEVWTQAIGSIVLSRFIGSTTQTADLTKYELIACLVTFLGGPIYPDGSAFSIAYDQSNGQQGWFRP
jgi:hypothetical protein